MHRKGENTFIQKHAFMLAFYINNLTCAENEFKTHTVAANIQMQYYEESNPAILNI